MFQKKRNGGNKKINPGERKEEDAPHESHSNVNSVDQFQAGNNRGGSPFWEKHGGEGNIARRKTGKKNALCAVEPEKGRRKSRSNKQPKEVRKTE